jgi:hypothetical protein
MCDSYLQAEVATQIEVIETVTKTIGLLAALYPSLRRLGVAETITARSRRVRQHGHDIPRARPSPGR